MRPRAWTLILPASLTVLVILLLAPPSTGTVEDVHISPERVEPSQPVSLLVSGPLVDHVTARFHHEGATYEIQRPVPPGTDRLVLAWRVPATASTGTWAVVVSDGADETAGSATRTTLVVTTMAPRLVGATASWSDGDNVAYKDGRLSLTATALDHNPPVTGRLYLAGDQLTHGPFLLEADRTGNTTVLTFNRTPMSLGVGPGTYEPRLFLEDGTGLTSQPSLPSGSFHLEDQQQPKIALLTPDLYTWEVGQPLVPAVRVVDDVHVQRVRAHLAPPTGGQPITWELDPEGTSPNGTGVYRAASPTAPRTAGTWQLTVEAFDLGDTPSRLQVPVGFEDTQPPNIRDVITNAHGETRLDHEVGRPLTVEAWIDDNQDVRADLRLEVDSQGTTLVPLAPTENGSFVGHWIPETPRTLNASIVATDPSGHTTTRALGPIHLQGTLAPRIQALHPQPGGTLPGHATTLRVLIEDADLDPRELEWRVWTGSAPPTGIDPLPSHSLETTLVPGGVEVSTHAGPYPPGTRLHLQINASDLQGLEASKTWTASVDVRPPQLRAWLDDQPLDQSSRVPVNPNREQVHVESHDEPGPAGTVDVRGWAAASDGSKEPGTPDHTLAPWRQAPVTLHLASMVPGDSEGPWTLVLEARDPAENRADLRVPLLVDARPPVVDARVEGRWIHALVHDAVSGVENVTAHVATPAGWQAVPMDAERPGGYVAELPEAPDGTWGRAWVEAYDLAGNRATVGSPLQPIRFQYVPAPETPAAEPRLEAGGADPVDPSAPIPGPSLLVPVLASLLVARRPRARARRGRR